MRKFDGIGLAKAIIWEEAKGKLRALIAADGSQVTDGSQVASEDEKYGRLEVAIDDFIQLVEDHGLHE